MIRFVLDLAKAEQLGMLFRSPNDHTAAPRTPPPNPGVQQVHGFTRRDGTVVAPHVRHVEPAAAAPPAPAPPVQQPAGPAPRQTSIAGKAPPPVDSSLWTAGPRGHALTDAGWSTAFERATGAPGDTRHALLQIEHAPHQVERRVGIGWVSVPSQHNAPLRTLAKHGLARVVSTDEGKRVEITPKGVQALEQYRVEGERLLARVKASHALHPLSKAEQLGLFRTIAGVQVHPFTRKDGTIVAGHIRHVEHVEHAAPAPKPAKYVTHYERSGPGAPQPGQKGYKAPPKREHELSLDGRTPEEIGTTAVAAAVALQHDPEVFWMWSGGSGGDDWRPDEDEGEQDTDTWTESDLPDLLAIPNHDIHGAPIPVERRVQLARWVFSHVLDDVPSAALPVDNADRYLADGYRLEPWALAAVLADALEPDKEFRMVDVSKAEASAFVDEHHSHLPEANLRGTMFVLGLRRGTRLVAVAIAGTPTGQWADQSKIFELTRVASDGTTPNASSKLTSRMLDLLPRTGRTLFVTYTFPEEKGTSYKALKDKGLRPVGVTSDHSSQKRRPGGSRRTATAASGKKIRWEAGPDAGPADWSLVPR